MTYPEAVHYLLCTFSSAEIKKGSIDVYTAIERIASECYNKLKERIEQSSECSKVFDDDELRGIFFKEVNDEIRGFT